VFSIDVNVIFCPKREFCAENFLPYDAWYHQVSEPITFGVLRGKLLPLTYPACSNMNPTLVLHRTWVYYRVDWLSIKFCENDFFRKLYVFFENTFQYLRGISQDISVSHFDSRRSLSSANRRRSTSPIFFVSFTQPCDQQDRKIRTIRKSAARWRGRRARGYRKSILRANLLYVPNIKM